MSKQNIETSGFGLAKEDKLVGDDFFVVKVMDTITVAVLCDGMGSAMAGAYASKHTSNYLINALKNRPKSWTMEKSIKYFIENINRILYLESLAEYEDVEMVTTLTLVVIEGDRLYAANVGDSRIYLLREDTLTQLSIDDNVEGVANALSSAIGLEEDVCIHYFENNLNTKDKILLCSDGLYTELEEIEMIKGIKVGASFLVKNVSRKYDDNLPDDTSAVIIDIKELDIRLQLKENNLCIQEEYKKGENIDGYILVKSLIENERTWLCEKNALRFVIKFIPYEAQEDEAMLDLFVKEVWIANRLKAGFFPKAIIPKKRTHRYYIMSYIEGENLNQYTKKRPLSIDLSIELGIFLLKMSQFLMKYNLLHADIKLDNIIITQRKGKSVFKMVDFGSITQAYSDINYIGTPSYIAPERFLNHPINEQTEIYSIGVTLYQALSKKFPYGEIEPFVKPSFDKSVKSTISYNAKIPNWLDSIILRSLDTDIDKRYKNYSQMQYELSNPEKVKPYFDKSVSFIERNQLLVARTGFIFFFILNIVQLLLF